jgi:ABC-type glutathione transport system ATPase component
MNLMTIDQLSKRFPIHSGAWRHRAGHVQALQNISFGISSGETLAVVGGSGSGKTTLAKILCGLLAADQGDVFWEERPLESFTRVEWARRVQMVFQDPYASLNPKLSIGLQLSEALRIADHDAQSAEDLLMRVGLARDALHRYPFQFSGGQRQRIAIARALALTPRLLILDEPLSALDVSTQEQIIALFQDVRKRNALSYLLITHDLNLAAQMADRVLVLQEGRLVEEGPAKQVLSAPKHAYTRALVDAVL